MKGAKNKKEKKIKQNILTPKSGEPNPYEIGDYPAVCVVTYTTIWRIVTGQDKISHY